VVVARVRVWHDEEGWGVLDSAGTPGGCWVHYSHVEMAGYRSLTGVDRVELEFQEVPQDGYRFTAVRVVVPGRPGVAEGAGTSGAYTSTLTLEFDDGRVLRLDGSGTVLSDEPAAPEG
jgi:CspA family cold shock protein